MTGRPSAPVALAPGGAAWVIAATRFYLGELIWLEAQVVLLIGLLAAGARAEARPTPVLAVRS